MLMVIGFFGETKAMENNKQLIIGCHPWDENMREFRDLDTSDFVDFRVEHTGAPEILPSNFYHLDTDNRGLYSSGNLSDFAKNHAAQYHTIIIDWATYHHIRREDAGVDFARLLTTNGSLIVPVAHIRAKEVQGKPMFTWPMVPVSKETAESYIKSKKLDSLFNEIKILSYQDTLQDPRCELLRRPGNIERLDGLINNMQAVIILCTSPVQDIY